MWNYFTRWHDFRPQKDRLFATVLLLLLHLSSTANGAAQVPNVVAASSLQFALLEANALFKARTGQSVKLTFGSSGNLSRQIRQGAPFEIFFSADEGYAKDLYRDGFASVRPRIYAVGRVVLMAPHGSSLHVDSDLTHLRSRLRAGQITRFAIANPAHAPYGKRAQEVLQHFGLWDEIAPHLVFGENVAQAAQFATSGSTEGGIIAYALALAPEVAALGNFRLLPHSSHLPLRQQMVLLKDAGSVARQFYRFIQQAESREILRRHGFAPPDQAD